MTLCTYIHQNMYKYKYLNILPLAARIMSIAAKAKSTVVILRFRHNPGETLDLHWLLPLQAENIEIRYDSAAVPSQYHHYQNHTVRCRSIDICVCVLIKCKLKRITKRFSPQHKHGFLRGETFQLRSCRHYT